MFKRHRQLGFLTVVLGAWLLAGCSGGGGGGSGGSGGGGSGGGGSGGGGSGGGGSNCGDATTGCEDSCGPDQFLDYDYDWCGPPPEGDDLHACAPRDIACDADVPACGCDGVVYDSECAAHEAGIDIGTGVSPNRSCGPELTPQGRFPCGPWYCDPATSYCFYQADDTGGRLVECKPLPDECSGTGSCDCLPLPSMFSECQAVQGNGVTGYMVHDVLQ